MQAQLYICVRDPTKFKQIQLTSLYNAAHGFLQNLTMANMEMISLGPSFSSNYFLTNGGSSGTVDKNSLFSIHSMQLFSVHVFSQSGSNSLSSYNYLAINSYINLQQLSVQRLASYNQPYITMQCFCNKFTHTVKKKWCVVM